VPVRLSMTLSVSGAAAPLASAWPSLSVAALIEGADAAVKAANVQLIEIRLAMALGGKAFVTLTGDVAAVQASVDAAAQVVGQKGMLVNKVVIPHPRGELLNEMI